MKNQKRSVLSSEEMSDFLDSIRWEESVRCILPSVRAAQIRRLKCEVRANLSDIPVDRSILAPMRAEIEANLRRVMVSAGENVGIICAQSIGERQTQSTLNSFHKCGLGVQIVTTGVPRFLELLNATKDPKLVSCELYLHPKKADVLLAGKLSSPKDMRRLLYRSVIENSFRELVHDFTILLGNENRLEPLWHERYIHLFPPAESNFLDKSLGFGISFQLKKEILSKNFISLLFIKKTIERKFKDLYCIVSPQHLAQIDIFCDVSDLAVPVDHQFITDKNKEEIYLEDVVLPRLMDLKIGGKPGLEKLIISMDNHGLQIRTLGSNFKELMTIPHLDQTRIRTNNMWEIYDVLGIEATREFLIDEYNLVTGTDSFLHPAHITLLVDIMTFHGMIISISRYGMKKETNGPLAKASFEECLDHFLQAGFHTEKEYIHGVSASIICGKKPRIGTGLCDLLVDLDHLGGKASSDTNNS